MFAQIWGRVVRGEYASVPAVAQGHARYAIKGEAYPGMVAEPGGAVEGVLYFDVVQGDIAALDAFEGVEYRRESTRVTLVGGETVQADTYIYLVRERLSESPWLSEAFQMERFIGSYCRNKLGD